MYFSVYGFLRYSEVSNLRMSDIVIHDSYMAIFIEKSKTDIYRNRNWLYLAKLKTKLYSITLLHNIVHISYTTIRENVLDALHKISLNSRKSGLDSLRSG